MTVPTITSITPNVGHTGGKTLVEIVGTGFRLQSPPPAPNPAGGNAPAPPPAPSVAVTFDGVPAIKVWVLSTTLIRALTPIHPQCGSALLDDSNNPVVPAAALAIQNLDATGAPIAGELVALPLAFSFYRPNLGTPGITQRVIEEYVNQLEIQLLDNIQLNPSTDYDPDSGDGMNFCEFAKLPGIAIVDIKVPKSPGAQRQEQTEIQTSPTTWIARRAPIVRDIVMTLIGASDNTGELLTLEEAVDTFHKKNPVVTILRDPAAPSKGTMSFQLQYAPSEDVVFSGRIGNTNVEVFTARAVIQAVPRSDIPGLPTVSIPGTTDGDNAEATVAAGYTLETVTTQVEQK